MTGRILLRLASVALPAIWMTGSIAGAAEAQAAAAPAAATQAASSAAQASPELVGTLSKELGATPEQAAGAAGSLFGVAKSKLSAADFAQVSKAVPGMSVLLKAAPTGSASPVSQLSGSAGGLATAATAFSKLGLSPEMVAKAIPVLTSFVTKSGGAGVGNLLTGALK